MSGKRFPARFPGLAVLLAVTLIGGVVMAMTATGAEPDSGEVSLDTRMINWKGEFFESASSPGGLGGYGQASRCLLPEDLPGCDQFSLNVNIPAEHWDTNTGGVEIEILPDPPAEGQAEDDNDNFDIYVYDDDDLPAPEPVPVTQSTTPGETAEQVIVPKATGAYTVVVQAADVTQSAYQGGVRVESRPNAGGDVPQEPLSNQPCVEGKSAGIFPCKGFDLQSFLPREMLGTGSELNDIWGWTDPETGKEYAIVGQQDGTSFVDVTDPLRPEYLGRLDTCQVQVLRRAERLARHEGLQEPRLHRLGGAGARHAGLRPSPAARRRPRESAGVLGGREQALLLHRRGRRSPIRPPGPWCSPATTHTTS